MSGVIEEECYDCVGVGWGLAGEVCGSAGLDEELVVVFLVGG